MDDYDEGYKWTRIDEIEMRALPLLGEGDTCYYFLNRVSGGFRASSTNDRIDDFKKSLRDFSGRPDVLRYKEDEIDRFAHATSRDFLEQRTFDFLSKPLTPRLSRCQPLLQSTTNSMTTDW